MKKFIITSFAAVALSVCNIANAAVATHTAIVKETHDAGIYTYILVDTENVQYWIAGPNTQVNIGQTIQFSEEMWMTDFKSKSLNRTFDKVLFVSDIQWPGMKKETAAQPSTTASITQANAGKDAGLLTVADIFTQKQALAGQLVSIRGEVVKVSKNIMGRTWVHIKDGTGQGDQAKIIFRSPKNTANVGDTVTAKGVLAIDQDFGYGYFYPAIVEDASFTQ